MMMSTCQQLQLQLQIQHVNARLGGTWSFLRQPHDTGVEYLVSRSHEHVIVMNMSSSQNIMGMNEHVKP